MSKLQYLFALSMLFYTVFKQNVLCGNKNMVMLERVQCTDGQNGSMAAVRCDVRRVTRERMKLNISIDLKRPVKDVWIHGVMYHKYNRYQKFPVDLWENLCGWLSGKTKSYILDWTTKMLLKHSNLNHSCPYNGMVLVRANSIPMTEFMKVEQLFPSGRFRADINLTEGYQKRVFFALKVFFSISDSRIEQF